MIRIKNAVPLLLAAARTTPLYIQKINIAGLLFDGTNFGGL
jgi:hypothetical protein|tara:strand:+ start:29 stop:151 length:123 start_codon:yes stop_codon:yes gene_type:complete